MYECLYERVFLLLLFHDMHNDLLIIVSHHHLSKITSFFKQWPTWRWLDFVTTFQNNLAVIKQQIVKKYFHQSWNINCPILFNTISFYTEMISISLFLGFHIELNILGTRDISCVLHEIQIRNTVIVQLLPQMFRQNWN